MSGKTLDYDSCAKWMSLSVWAVVRYQQLEATLPVTQWTDDGLRTLFFHEIAVEALNRGFSLRAGYRSWAVGDLLRAIAPADIELYAAYLRIDKETWLTRPGERRKAHA